VVRIYFVRSPEVVETLREKGFSVYSSGEGTRDGLVEVPTSVEGDMLEYLSGLNADPEVPHSKVLIPPEVSDEDVSRLITACVSKMGYRLRREADELIGDTQGVSFARSRMNAVAEAVRNGRSASFIGA
jgi:hypothetical protein